ncbi:MAG TPA: succinyl-diaminopimelate desuccinylase [Propionibacteriaceae bacterium]|nr:succinyl-diaminopimelate desuccinylase [Propionibacteriaceae bacterium]
MSAIPLDLDGDVVDLLARLVDIESVSGNEVVIADLVEQALRRCAHLEVIRDGNVVIARTDVGRDERVVIAGHLDTVPIAANVPSWRTGEGEHEIIWGRGSCDMKGGVAVQLSAAARLAQPRRDITWIFYDNEEVQAELNGLGRLSRERPELLAGSFAVLGEPSNAGIEGGCQGTMRVEIELRGVAAHSARAWKGHNAIHDAAAVLQRLCSYRPADVEVEGLVYREGLNAVKISGGIAGNVIPDRCTVVVNYRFAPDKDVAAAEAHVREVFDGFELAVTDASAGARPGLDRPAAAEFLAAVGGAAHAKFGWTDVALFASLGVPAVNFGPGDPSKAHADDECCPAAEVVSCRDALVRWLG